MASSKTVSKAARVVALFAVLCVVACGAADEGPQPTIEPELSPPAPTPAPVCKSSNTAPGCTPSSAAWAVTCDAPVPAPAVWCTLPEGGGDGRTWCC
jgi:hypothetical protein